MNEKLAGWLAMKMMGVERVVSERRSGSGGGVGVRVVSFTRDVMEILWIWAGLDLGEEFCALSVRPLIWKPQNAIVADVQHIGFDKVPACRANLSEIVVG